MCSCCCGSFSIARSLPFHADLATVAIATACSLVLHPLVTMSSNPLRRWIEESPGSYLSTNIGSLCTDVVVFTLLTDRWGADAPGPILGAKFLALCAAVMVRFTAYRSLIRRAVRNDQRTRRPRTWHGLGPVSLGSRSSFGLSRSHRIANTVAQIRSDLGALHTAGTLKVVVVDDGSTDGTFEAAQTGRASRSASTEYWEGRCPPGGHVGRTRSGARLFRCRSLAYSPSELLHLG